MRKLFAIAILLMLAVPAALALDLTDYPYFFMKDNKLDVVFVIGDNADIADAIGAVEIATSLQVLQKVQMEAPAKLASEIGDPSQQNMIVVGGPCANAIAAQLLGYPTDCTQGFTKGRAVIKLFERPKSLAVVVAGANSWDTRRACRVLADYSVFKNQLSGNEIEVSGTSFTDMTVKQTK